MLQVEGGGAGLLYDYLLRYYIFILRVPREHAVTLALYSRPKLFSAVEKLQRACYKLHAHVLINHIIKHINLPHNHSEV